MASAPEGQSTATSDEEESTPREEEGAQSREEEGAQSREEEGAAPSNQEEGGDEGGDSNEQDDQQAGAASGKSMASAIEDVSSLPGETINDQDGRKLGEVKDIYAVGEDDTPMWVTVESA